MRASERRSELDRRDEVIISLRRGKDLSSLSSLLTSESVLGLYWANSIRV